MATDAALDRVRRVVVACDFSEGSTAAVARGSQVAKAHGARIDLLHAFDVGALRALRGGSTSTACFPTNLPHWR